MTRRQNRGGVRNEKRESAGEELGKIGRNETRNEGQGEKI